MINKKLYPILMVLTIAVLVMNNSPQIFASTIQPLIGVNITGSEYSWETYPNASHLDYLQSKGIKLIRLPTAWEKFQPALNSALDQTEVGKLKAFLDLASAREMQVIIDVHNYGRYNSHWAQDAAANYGIVAVSNSNSTPYINTIGSTDVPISAFKDLWTKLATTLSGHVGLAGYDIMNEPNNMGAATVWPLAAQAAVDGIRSVDTSTTIYVEGTQWSSAYWWPSDNGNLHITDPSNNLIYEAHLYFDGNGSGIYSQTYDQQGANPNWGVDHVQPFLNWLQVNNAKGFIGEVGVPDNDPRWLTLLDNFLIRSRPATSGELTGFMHTVIPRALIPGGH